MILPSIGVAYLLRGKDADWRVSVERFVTSYLRHPAGCPHRLYVITKGLETSEDKAMAQKLIALLPRTEVPVADDSFDVGAYREWACGIGEELICVLNTGSEILGDLWLLKLAVNLQHPEVGIVGATGSFESLGRPFEGFPRFPNAHMRTNACLLRRELYLDATLGRRFSTKEDTFQFESGHTGLTRYIKRAGLLPLVVGRNGRGYGEAMWPLSDTFRQGRQRNVLVGDRNTRGYAASTWHEKHFLASRAWGLAIEGEYLYRWS